jgi:hypothetical protein
MQAMPALAEIAPELINADVAAPEVAEPEVAEAAGAEVSTQGAVPDIGPNGMPLETGQTASEQAFGDKPTAQSGEVDGGMYQPADYKAACTAAGIPDKWDDKYEAGHTEAGQWDQPYENPYEMTFTLKAGQSASQALKDFIAGPTIANFQTIAVALELDEVRDGMGNEKFDALFGSTTGDIDAQIPKAQRLQISSGMYTIPFAAQMEQLADDYDDANKAEEPQEPQVAAQVEEKPVEGGVTAQPAPEMVADEMGIQREQELA